MDRIANPDTSTKAGTIGNIRRNEEILVYVARYFDNNTVALCPGAFGKQLALGLKSLNEKLRPLYDQYKIPCGFSNRFCIAACCRYWGGRDKEEDFYLAESDFGTWPTHDFDRFASPAGWQLEPRSRASQHVETWKINAINTARMFAAVYEEELLQERLGAIEYLRSLHIDYPHKYTLTFIRSTWGTLNYRWTQELRDMTNVLRMRAQVERPTFSQLRPIGMTIVTATGITRHQRPKTFDLQDPHGYFVTEILRRMNEEKELNERKAYHSVGGRTGNPRVGAVAPTVELPGPPMAPAERRIAGKEAPKTASGDRICWNYNSHLGCDDQTCTRAHQFYKNFEQLPYALKIELAKRFGFKKRQKLSAEQVSSQIKSLRQNAQAEIDRNRTQPGVRGDTNPMQDPARRVGKTEPFPSCLVDLDYTDQGGELRKAIHQPSIQFGSQTPQEEFNHPTTPILVEPSGGDPLLVEPLQLLEKVKKAPELSFLSNNSPHLSTYVTARVMQDFRHGLSDTRESVRRALLTASTEGVETLKREAGVILDSHNRSGKSAVQFSNTDMVSFSAPRGDGVGTVTDMTLRGRTYSVYDFGDTLPVIADDPSNEVYGSKGPDKNKCLLLHIAASYIRLGTNKGSPKPCSELTMPEIINLARQYRQEQMMQATQCKGELGDPTNNDPLVVAELRSHVHDVCTVGHDRDRRVLLCFPLSCMDSTNVCIIRVTPSCRYTVHLINSTHSSISWIYLVSYQEHMRMIQCNEGAGGRELRNSPKTATNPTGWGNLLNFCTTRVTIDQRNLSRCPHCQAPHIRLPLGVEGTLVGRAMLMSDAQLRQFSIAKP